MYTSKYIIFEYLYPVFLLSVIFVVSLLPGTAGATVVCGGVRGTSFAGLKQRPSMIVRSINSRTARCLFNEGVL